MNKTCLKQNVTFSLLPLLGKYSYAFGQQLTMPTAPSVLPPSPTSGKSRTAVYRACAKISVKAVYCTFTKAFYRVNGLLLLLLLSPSDMSYSEDLSDDLFTWWMLLFNELLTVLTQQCSAHQDLNVGLRIFAGITVSV